MVMLMMATMLSLKLCVDDDDYDLLLFICSVMMMTVVVYDLRWWFGDDELPCLSSFYDAGCYCCYYYTVFVC